MTPSNGEPRHGPWDATEPAAQEKKIGRIDLGSLIVTAAEGVRVRLDRVGDGPFIAVTLSRDGDRIQLQAFSAPHRPVWDHIREQIQQEFHTKGQSAEDAIGAFGPELVVPDAGAGEPGKQMRFIGSDGPGWLLRGVIVGSAAATGSAGNEFEEIFRATIVVRGESSLAELAPLLLRPPGG